MDKETVEIKTKELMNELKKHVDAYRNGEAEEDFENNYVKLINLHIKTISKMKLFDENMQQLKETIQTKLDKKYLPKIKKAKPVLTDDELLEKKRKNKLKREQIKQQKELGTYIKKEKREKRNDLFVIPILHNI